MSHILMQNDTVAGFLAGALCSVVTEEGDGVYELSYTYPVTGRTFLKIAIDRLKKPIPSVR